MTTTGIAAPAAGQVDDADRLALRTAVREFLADQWSRDQVQRLLGTERGYDERVWRQMAEQLGLQGLMIPGEFGGSGSRWTELVVVLEEMGAALTGGPFLSTVVLAATLLCDSGNDELKAQYLPRIASGELTATVAVPLSDQWPRSGKLPLSGSAGVTVRSTGREEDVCLTGEIPVVLNGQFADLLLVPASSDSGEVGIFAVPAAAAGLTVTPIESLDLTRRQARVDLAGTPARTVATGPAAAVLLTRALLHGALGVAAEQAGGCSAAMTMSVEYAKIRHQFGKPIGAFQAIKHLCADMLLATESTTAAARRAALAAANEEPDFAELVGIAKAYGSTAYLQVAVDTVQLHGGIGYTWEHPAHLHLRRAKTSELLFGDARYHRGRLAAQLGM